MKTSGILLLIVFVISSCKHKTGKKVNSISIGKTVDVTVPSLEQRLTDSLFKYIHLTEFLNRGDVSTDTRYVLYSKEVNKSKIGIVAIESSKFLLFQNIGNKFLLTDSFAFDNYPFYFKEDDLNGDYKNDFIVSGMPNMHGQAVLYIFMCDRNNILHYRPDLNLFNVSYDNKNKLVQSFYEGGAYDVHYKELYRWVNDSLELVAGAELDLTHPNYIETRLYKIKHGKEVYYKKLRDKEGSFYNKALFDINSCL